MGESRSSPATHPPPIRRASPVVVTGGAGLLGREVVRQLIDEGCRDIRVVDLRAVPAAEGGPVHAHRLDLLHDDLAPAFTGANAVFHLAACQYHSPLAPTTYQLPFYAINVEGTRRALDAARRAGVATFVHVSSSMVYGVPRQRPRTGGGTARTGA